MPVPFVLNFFLSRGERDFPGCAVDSIQHSWLPITAEIVSLFSSPLSHVTAFQSGPIWSLLYLVSLPDESGLGDVPRPRVFFYQASKCTRFPNGPSRAV